jgi:predicted nucleic acid-binding protein
MTATYVDSSAIVKLAVREPQSDALSKYLPQSSRRPSSGSWNKTENCSNGWQSERPVFLEINRLSFKL